MKFWIISDEGGQTVGCEFTKAAAMREGWNLADRGTVNMVEVEVSAENMRRLLGNLGGYATKFGNSVEFGEEA